ncbi:MAG TPA: cytochrome c [Candidatus Cybelea sp.]|nr:cytochrome c [Candidatus Cybelea sp.]
MAVRPGILLCVLFAVVCAAARQDPIVNTAQLPPTNVPSGKVMYKQYCAACHGADGKGRGPAASSLNTRPADLTTLAKRHDGKFPQDYVAGVLRFGPTVSPHGSSEMPVWGPIFQYVDNYEENATRQRIKNLCDYLQSLQGK